MTADHSPSGANRERPLRPASLIASGARVIYWLSLTFGLLQPHVENFQVGMAVLRAGSGVADALSTPSGPSRW